MDFLFSTSNRQTICNLNLKTELQTGLLDLNLNYILILAHFKLYNIFKDIIFILHASVLKLSTIKLSGLDITSYTLKKCLVNFYPICVNRGTQYWVKLAQIQSWVKFTQYYTQDNALF